MRLTCPQNKIATGLSKAASILGINVKLYRATDSTGPYENGYLFDTLCLFDSAASLSGTSPLIWGHKFAFAAINTSASKCGDYLVVQSDTELPSYPQDTYFIARIELTRPILVVLTNEVISIFESDVSSDDKSVGLRPPEGPTWKSDRIIAENWPVSMLKSGTGNRPASRLGTDIPSGSFEILMPAIPNVTLHQGLRVKTSHGVAYHIYSVEMTTFGTRIAVLADQT